MSASIQVERVKLIAFLEAEQKKDIAEFKKQMEKFRVEERGYKSSLVAALKQVLKSVQAGELPTESRSIYFSGTHRQTVAFAELPAPPQKPSRSRRACELERMLATLKLCSDAKIRLNEKSEYMQFVCKL